MEVKIGIADSSRELVVSSDQTPDEVQKLVDEALGSADGLLRLADEKGRRYVVRAAQIAYVEIAPEDVRRVGFAIGWPSSDRVSMVVVATMDTRSRLSSPPSTPATPPQTSVVR